MDESQTGYAVDINPPPRPQQSNTVISWTPFMAWGIYTLFYLATLILGMTETIEQLTMEQAFAGGFGGVVGMMLGIKVKQKRIAWWLLCYFASVIVSDIARIIAVTVWGLLEEKGVLPEVPLDILAWVMSGFYLMSVAVLAVIAAAFVTRRIKDTTTSPIQKGRLVTALLFPPSQLIRSYRERQG